MSAPFTSICDVKGASDPAAAPRAPLQCCSWDPPNRSGSNGAGSTTGASPHIQLRDEPPGDRPERDARALVAGREPEPRHRARRPDRREVVGQPRPQPRPRGRHRQRRHAREQPRGARDHRLAHGGVDGRVEAAPLARRADEHVALPRRLHDRADLEPAAATSGPSAGRSRRRPCAGPGPARARRAGRAGPCAARAAAASPAPSASAAAPRPRGEHHGVRPHPLAVPRVRRAGGDTAVTSHALAHVGAGRGGLADQRPRDRARIALQVVREEARAAHLAGELRLAARAPRPASSSRASGIPTRATRAASPAQVSASGCTISAPLRRIRASSPSRASSSPYSASPARARSSSGPASLSEQSTLPSPSPVVPPDTAPRSSSVDRHAADRQLARHRGADDAGADHDDVGHRAKPAGNGSSASSRYCPMPVIQARPVISGTIAGRPATVVSSATRPVKRVPITDSLTNASPTASSPRACSWASRADVPVPHGERSSQPGWIAVAARASAPSRPSRVQDDVLAAGHPRVARVHRAVGGVDRGDDREARLDQLVRACRIHLQPDRGRRQQRVEVAAEGHVVDDAPEPGHLDRAVARVQEARDVAQRDRPRAAALDRHARLDQPGRRVEPHDGLGLAHLHHPGLDEHGGDADRPVPAHRQQPADLDEQHAPVGVRPRRRLEDRARHRAVPARLAHQQQPQVVQLAREVVAPLEHRRARDRRDAADDDARRHPLRVRVDRRDRARRAHPLRRRPARAARRPRPRGSPCRPRRAPAAAAAPARR